MVEKEFETFTWEKTDYIDKIKNAFSGYHFEETAGKKQELVES